MKYVLMLTRTTDDGRELSSVMATISDRIDEVSLEDAIYRYGRPAIEQILFMHREDHEAGHPHDQPPRDAG